MSRSEQRLRAFLTRWRERKTAVQSSRNVCHSPIVEDIQPLDYTSRQECVRKDSPTQPAASILQALEPAVRLSLTYAIFLPRILTATIGSCR